MNCDWAEMSIENYHQLQDQTIRETLQTQGYIQLPINKQLARDLETKFDDWRNSFGDTNLHTVHGIYKSNGIGATDFMYTILCLIYFRYQARREFHWLFTKLYSPEPQDVIFSLDGACYYENKDWPISAKRWLHRDLKPSDLNTVCYQSVIDLIPTTGGLTVQSGSHHVDTTEYKSEGKGDWWKIPETLMIGPLQTLAVTQPMITIWDSRLFHMNTTGHRKALYISAQPRKPASTKHDWQRKRLRNIQDQRTTSHWAHKNSPNPDVLYNYGNPIQTGKIRSKRIYTPTNADLQLVGIVFPKKCPKISREIIDVENLPELGTRENPVFV